MCGSAVPIVKVFENVLWTAFPTILRPKCTRLQDFAYTISKFSWGCPGPRSGGSDFLQAPASALSTSPVLGPRHQILIGLPAFPLFLFYETTIATDLYENQSHTVIIVFIQKHCETRVTKQKEASRAYKADRYCTNWTLCGWSGRLKQSPTGHSFVTYITNFRKHAQYTSFLTFLLH